MNKDTIIGDMHHINDKYKNTGFVFVSLFGSYANGTNNFFSDIDLTYRINHDVFYKDDAFAKLEKIQEIKKELEEKFHKRVDLIPANTKNHLIKESLKREQILI